MTDNTSTSTRPTLLWLLLGGLVLALGGLVFVASGAIGSAGTANAPVVERETAPLVETATVTRTDNTFTVSAPGRLQARQTLRVVGEVPGKISYLNPALQVGGRLEEGEVMLRIDAGDYRADLARAEAQLRTAQAEKVRAEADLARQTELESLGTAPPVVLEQAQATAVAAAAALSQAEAAITLARRGLNKTTLRTPFPAIVLSEDLSTDTYVAPGAELARIMDATAAELEAGLSPRDVTAVRRALAESGEEGLEVRAVPNSGSLGEATLDGTIESFAPAIDPVSRTVAVRAVFPGAFSAENKGAVFAGDFMTLEIEGRSPSALYAVPAGAIRRNAALWALDDENTLFEVAVTPVETRAGTALVSSPSDIAGLRILVTPLAEERAGMAVRPTSADSAGR